jgi:hypothetical protein
MKILSNTLTTGEVESMKVEREKIKDENAKIRYLPYMFWYYHYMGGVQYINDGNADLIDLGFVDPENPEDNAEPLSIISYKDKFGNKQHVHGEGLSVNAIVEINISEAQDIVIESFYEENPEGFILTDIDNYVEMKPTNDTILINKVGLRTILRLLLDDKIVIFNPSTYEGYNSLLYDKLVRNLNTIYKNIDFGFHPQHKISTLRSSFYKPIIDMNQVILFRPDSRLIDFLAMQLSLEDFSIFINTGSYEFMSLIRIAFIFKPNVKCTIPVITKVDTPQAGGGKKCISKYNINDTIQAYTDIFENPIKCLINKSPSKKKSKKNSNHKKSKKSRKK